MDSEPTNRKLFCVNQQHASIHQPTQHYTDMHNNNVPSLKQKHEELCSNTPSGSREQEEEIRLIRRNNIITLLERKKMPQKVSKTRLPARSFLCLYQRQRPTGSRYLTQTPVRDLHELRTNLPLCCIGLPIHCNYQLAHYSGFCRIAPSILNRSKPNLQA